jgi:hypothetical protein
MGLLGNLDDGLVLAVIIVVLLLITFSEQISYFLSALKTTVVALIEGKEKLPCGCYGNCTCHKLLMPDEHFQDPQMDASNPNTVRGGGSDVLQALGYEDGQSISWDAMIKTTDLDPSVHRNHENFVADVRRFSSGANFTSVQDDNTNSAFTNFVGLRRPQHVDILPDARQQPDIDQDVLQRNKPLIW